MPNGHEGKNDPDVPDLRLLSAEGDENVSDEPLVESSVPASPEILIVIPVVHAPVHVFGHLHVIEQRPAARKLPDRIELEIDELEARGADDYQLSGIELAPDVLVLNFGDDRKGVVDVDEDLHANHDEESSQPVPEHLFPGVRVLRRLHLRVEGVESQRWTRNEGGRVEQVRVVVEQVVLREIMALVLSVPEAHHVFRAGLALAQVLAFALHALLRVRPPLVAGEADHFQDGHVKNNVPIEGRVHSGLFDELGHLPVREEPSEVIPMVLLIEVERDQVDHPDRRDEVLLVVEGPRQVVVQVGKEDPIDDAAPEHVGDEDEAKDAVEQEQLVEVIVLHLPAGLYRLGEDQENGGADHQNRKIVAESIPLKV